MHLEPAQPICADLSEPVEHSCRRFIKVIALLVLPSVALLLLLLFCNYRFLKSTGEFLEPLEIIESQSRLGSLWQVATRDGVPSFKLELYKQIKPQIVVFGSSRTNHFHQEYFTRPYVGMGNAAHNLVEIEYVLQLALQNHKPDVLLIGVDETFFLPKLSATRNTIPRKLHQSKFPSLEELRLPFGWISDGRIPIEVYWRYVLGHLSEDQLRLGVRANFLNVGFAIDGSQYEDPPWRREPLCDASRFASYVPLSLTKPTNPDPATVAAYKNILKLAKEHSVPLITFFPPYPTSVNHRLLANANSRAFIESVSELVASTSPRHYDFREFGDESNDCEYLDAQHGGDVTFARVARKMGQDPNGTMKKFVKADAVNQIIGEYGGLPTIPLPKKIFQK